jgi:hypothetical protein
VDHNSHGAVRLEFAPFVFGAGRLVNVDHVLVEGRQERLRADHSVFRQARIAALKRIAGDAAQDLVTAIVTFEPDAFSVKEPVVIDKCKLTHDILLLALLRPP